MIEIIGKEEALLESLIEYYKKNPEHLIILSSISKQKTLISLREIDHTVTNYSDNNKVVYKLKNGTNFNMYLDYKCQLRGYSKKFFDPFCRRKRIFAEFKDIKITYLEDNEIDSFKLREDGVVTTIGQMAFFKWAIMNEVIDYCFNNKESIDKEMDNYSIKKQNDKKEIEKKIKTTIKVEKMKMIPT